MTVINPSGMVNLIYQHYRDIKAKGYENVAH